MLDSTTHTQRRFSAALAIAALSSMTACSTDTPSSGNVSSRSAAMRTLALAQSQATLTLDAPSPVVDFDYETGNIALELIPRIVPVTVQTVSPSLGDAPLILRITLMVTNSWFDAIAPYHESAVGVHSSIPRRPVSESENNVQKNVAMAYATYRVLMSLMPQGAESWAAAMTDLGLDPSDDSEDLETAVGIGNHAGNAVVAARLHDGMNQLGDEGGRVYNLQPYADYTGYAPVNTPDELRFPSRWQPDINTTGTGLFFNQRFVTPQLRLTQANTYDDVSQFRVKRPIASIPRGRKGRKKYKAQVDEVLELSAQLTDYQKASAELFDNKLRSLAFSVLAYAQINQLSLDEFVHLDYLTNVAAFDGAIAVWQEKYRHDAVRPFSAIKHVYGDEHVTAWGGPGRGTVTDMPASQWRSYLSTANHPEYPSASACFCAAHSQAIRRFTGSDDFGWAVEVPQGSSQVEPGITPATDIVLGPYATWTQFEEECGISRVWAGTHFTAAIETSQDFCPQFGDRAFDFVQSHLKGELQ